MSMNTPRADRYLDLSAFNFGSIAGETPGNDTGCALYALAHISHAYRHPFDQAEADFCKAHPDPAAVFAALRSEWYQAALDSILWSWSESDETGERELWTIFSNAVEAGIGFMSLWDASALVQDGHGRPDPLAAVIELCGHQEKAIRRWSACPEVRPNFEPVVRSVWPLLRRLKRQQAIEAVPLRCGRVVTVLDACRTLRSAAAAALPAAEAVQTPEDVTAYRLATEFLDDDIFTTYKKLTGYLKANPWIRSRKPSGRRLLLHAGDVIRLRTSICKTRFEAGGVPAEVADTFAAESRRPGRQENRGREAR